MSYRVVTNLLVVLVIFTLGSTEIKRHVRIQTARVVLSLGDRFGVYGTSHSTVVHKSCLIGHSVGSPETGKCHHKIFCRCREILFSPATVGEEVHVLKMRESCRMVDLSMLPSYSNVNRT
jgi:hypothetical protein